MMRKVDGWELAPEMGVACETLILLRLAEQQLCYLATSFGLLAWYCYAQNFIPLFMYNLIWKMEEELVSWKLEDSHWWEKHVMYHT
jgi:hypothetical protein